MEIWTRRKLKVSWTEIKKKNLYIKASRVKKSSAKHHKREERKIVWTPDDKYIRRTNKGT